MYQTVDGMSQDGVDSTSLDGSCAGGECKCSGRVVSVGIDLTLVADVRESVETFGDRYLRRVFTPQELIDSFSTTDPMAGLAARFAAKEATIKALKVDGAQPTWTSMEVHRNASGSFDQVRVTGEAAGLAARRGIETLSLSLSHEAGGAIAIVVAEADS